jgi:hypothetical protein
MGPYIVLDPEKGPQKVTWPKKFLLFAVLLQKNGYIPGVLSFKINFSSKNDSPKYTVTDIRTF